MAALFTLLSLLLAAPSHADIRARARMYARAGHDDVARIYRLAAPEYRAAISAAYHEVDPKGEHPDWELELYRICKRESWCGHYGAVGIHAGDGWAGVSAYAGAVSDGLLDPANCPEHRLIDYSAVTQLVDRRVASGRWTLRRGNRVRSALASAEVGTRRPVDFSTRGGWGQMQARQVHKLGKCVAPEQADDPRNGARLAALTIAGCQRWDGNPGKRYRRHCTCAERTRKWVGGGRWDSRSLWRNTRSVNSQCGQHEATSWFASELARVMRKDTQLAMAWALVRALWLPL